MTQEGNPENNGGQYELDERRRTLLKLPVWGMIGSSALASAGVASGQSDVQVTKKDFTGDGSDDIRIENSEVFLQFNSEDISTRRLVSTAGRQGGSNLFRGGFETRPSLRHSSHQHRPEFQPLRSFEILEDGGSVGAFRISREYTYHDELIEITADVTLFTDDNFFLIELTYENIGSGSLTLDQDPGNIHDGIMIFNGLGLAGRSDGDDEYRFHLAGQSTRKFANTYKWQTFSATNRGTFFDSQDALTYGLLDGATAPKMWIEEPGHLDFLVQETTLDPGQSITYSNVFGLHSGGSDAPDTGAQIYNNAQDRVSKKPSLELKNVRPVQTVENSFVDDPNVSENISDPDMIAGRPTSVLFKLKGQDIEELDDSEIVKLTVSTDTGITKTADLRGKRIKELAYGPGEKAESVEEEKVFANAPRAERPPIFTLDSEISSLRVGIAQDSNNIEGHSVEKVAGSEDFGMTDSITLRIGFIEVRAPLHPQDNTTQSDWAYGRSEDGRFHTPYDLPGGDVFLQADDPRDKLRLIVEETERFLERVYPVEEIETKIHPNWVQGVRNDWIPDILEDDHVEDLREAHDRLTTEFDGLHATVAVTPTRYADYHGEEGIGGEYGICGDVQPQIAAWMMDITDLGRNAFTIAQEIGHHLEGLEAYPEPLAQQRQGLCGMDRDQSHARTENLIDEYALRSTAFDLFDDTFSVLREGTIRGYWGHGRNEIDDNQRDWHLGSFMSYSSDDVWTDAHVYQQMIDDVFAPTPPMESDETSDTDGTVLTGTAAVDDDGQIHVADTTKRQGQPMPDDPSGQVSLEMIAFDDSVITSRKSQDSLVLFSHDGGNRVLENAFTFVDSFPENAVEMRIGHEKHNTVMTINPIARTLENAIRAIPDQGFENNPDELRQALFNKLDAIDKKMDEKKFWAAKQQMKEDVRDKLEKWLRDDYDAAANQPTKQEMLELVDDMIARLETPAQNSSEGGR